MVALGDDLSRGMTPEEAAALAPKETIASGMVSGEVVSVGPVDGVTLVFLSVVEVPGYGQFKVGDVATFERKIAKQLLLVGRGEDDLRPKVVARYKEGMELPEPTRARGRI